MTRICMSVLVAGFVAAFACLVRAEPPIPVFPIEGSHLTIGGEGFFILEDADGRRYTRVVIVRFDNSGILVNEDGRYIKGYGISPPGVPNGALGVIDLRTASSQPIATRTIEADVNLDPRDTAMPGWIAGFDHTDPAGTSNFQAEIRVYDSLGNSRDISIYFIKNSIVANSWLWFAGTRRGELDLAAYGGPFAGMSPTPADQFFPVQSGELIFRADGLLARESQTAVSIRYDGDGILNDSSFNVLRTPGNGATGWHFDSHAMPGQRVRFDFGISIAEGGTGSDASTEFPGASSEDLDHFVRSLTQDGYPAGMLMEISIDSDGFLVGWFSNGRLIRLAQIALARFPNPHGLLNLGKDFIETLESGAAIEGSPNQSGLGPIQDVLVDTCERELDICVHTGSVDLDADGEAFANDRCPDTPGLAPVDDAGCSQAQFCEGVDVRDLLGLIRCFRSDWQNDEPLKWTPRDCGLVRLPDARGWDSVLCVPR